jgi:hypothetical protein
MFALLAPGCNPFAPDVDLSGGDGSSILADQKTVEGVFQNMRYAYTFKDTTIYGRLLDGDFTFTYRDYDKLIDVSWGRDDEMRITNQLFQNASNLNLTWNNIVGQSGDSLLTDVTRSFTLSITFNPSDMMRVDGKVSLKLARKSSLEAWRIVLWKDESNY